MTNPARGTRLGARIRVAETYFSRLRGLLGRPALEPGEGLLIVPSRGVHMYGMRFPLDVLLIDDQRQVRRLYPNLKPGQSTGMHRGVRYALELPVGTIADSMTQEGDELEWTT